MSKFATLVIVSFVIAMVFTILEVMLDIKTSSFTANYAVVLGAIALKLVCEKKK